MRSQLETVVSQRLNSLTHVYQDVYGRLVFDYVRQGDLIGDILFFDSLSSFAAQVVESEGNAFHDFSYDQKIDCIGKLYDSGVEVIETLQDEEENLDLVVSLLLSGARLSRFLYQLEDDPTHLEDAYEARIDAAEIATELKDRYHAMQGFSRAGDAAYELFQATNSIIWAEKAYHAKHRSAILGAELGRTADPAFDHRWAGTFASYSALFWIEKMIEEKKLAARFAGSAGIKHIGALCLFEEAQAQEVVYVLGMEPERAQQTRDAYRLFLNAATRRTPKNLKTIAEKKIAFYDHIFSFKK